MLSICKRLGFCGTTSTFVILFSVLALLGCGVTKKEEGKSATGETILNVSIELQGSLVGYDFWEGGFDVFAVGEDDAGNVLAYADGKTRSQVSISGALVGADTPKGVMSFQLPLAAAKWRLEVDSIVGRVCEFAPNSGLVADLPTPQNSGSSTLAINSTCTTAYKVSGTVNRPVEGLVINMSGEEFVVDAVGEPAAFTFTITGDRSAVQPNSGAGVILGNASAYWKGLEAQTAAVADWTITAALPDAQACTVKPNQNRYEEPVKMYNQNITYTKIFNRLNAIEITCPTEEDPGTDPEADAEYSLSATVTGLTSGTLTLRNNINLNELEITADGTHSFSEKITANDGYDYDVRILGQPAGQTCVLADDVGTASADVTVTVTCSAAGPMTYTIGGTVSDIPSGESVTLLLTYGVSNTTEELEVMFPVFDPASFTFTSNLEEGTDYAVTVMESPSGYTCDVDSGGSGTLGAASVSDVAVSCEIDP